MNLIESITTTVADADAVRPIYESLGIADRVHVSESEGAATGFGGFTISLIVAQPATVNSLTTRALNAGAVETKPPAKSLWGYGAAVTTPDGTVVTIASSSKKSTGTDTGEIEELVLQLGVDDVTASKSFYAARGLSVSRSYGKRYAQFDTGAITLALTTLKNLARAAGAPPETAVARTLTVRSDAGTFTDPSGFSWLLRD